MNQPAPTSSSRSGGLRLLLAFALGLTSPLFFAPLALQPRWWQPAIALAVLLAAAILGAILARGDSGRSTAGRLFLELAGIVVLIGGLGSAFVFLRLVSVPAVDTEEYRQAFFVTQVLTAAFVPVLMGIASALVAQRHPNAIRALGGAELGWLGAYIANLVVALLGPILAPKVSNPSGVGTTVVLVAGVGVIGFALAALGSLMGWGLRALGGGSKP